MESYSPIELNSSQLQLVDELLNPRLIQRSDELRDGLSITERNYGGQSSDLRRQRYNVSPCFGA